MIEADGPHRAKELRRARRARGTGDRKLGEKSAERQGHEYGVLTSRLKPRPTNQQREILAGSSVALYPFVQVRQFGR
jgi:hypothetical protein